MFNLTILTYRGLYAEMECNSVNLPTPDGRWGILPNRMPIMLPISIGIMYVRTPDGEKKYTVDGGIFYIENNVATLLIEEIEDVENIDIERARKAQRNAEERIRNAQTEYDINRARIALQKAINRINAKVLYGPQIQLENLEPLLKALHYQKHIEATFQLPTVMWDERLSTMAAERVLLEADVSRKKRKKVIDKMAAVMILQGYLDSK